MLVLLATVYIIVATYYMIGILRTFNAMVNHDSALGMFMRRCWQAKFFSILLIVICAYLWPIGMFVRSSVSRAVDRRLRKRIKEDYSEKWTEEGIKDE